MDYLFRNDSSIYAPSSFKGFVPAESTITGATTLRTNTVKMYKNPLQPNIENRIYVLVPIYNFETFIRKCMDSMLAQRYTNWMAILYDDGSTDSSKDICRQYQQSHKKHFKVVHVAQNAGPAATKYNGIQYIKSIASNADIMMIVDGDDYLMTQDAFGIINQTYLTTKCWFTYGSFDGKWSNQTIDIPRQQGLMKTNILYRQISWRYGHPRTVRCHLLEYFKESDFKYNGKWLTKCTDRPFIFNICEWSGQDKIQYIPNIIYFYRDHPNNTYKNVSTRFKQEQLDYIGNLEPQKQIIEPIHVVMCCWKRTNLLRKILDNQNEQTVANKIHLHILNNNPRERYSIDDIVFKFKATSPAITITLKHFENKFYGFQRFYYIKDYLLPNHIADYVVMIDDDQQFSTDWVELLYNLRQPNTYKSWWGTAFTSHNYWQKRHTIDDKFDYGGTGGSIIDTTIFLPTTKLWNVPVDPIVYNIEDLWLSFIVRHHYGWDIVCSFLPPLMKNKAFRGTDVVAQHKTLRDKKQILLTYLIKKHHWKFLYNSSIKPVSENNSIYAESATRYLITKKNNEIQYVSQ